LAALTVASISFAVSKVVGIPTPFHCTLDPSTKPAPWMSSVNPEQPAFREDGVSKLIVELKVAEAPR
jgi:hypothetical protein